LKKALGVSIGFVWHEETTSDAEHLEGAATRA
jgi:hypothetical protein